MMPPLRKSKRLDVRALLQNGLDPCSPLIERLGAQEFASKVERGKGADWLVYFWREAP